MHNLSAPCRLVKDCLHYQDLDRTVRRLKSLSTTQGIILGACNVTPWLELCCKLEDALRDVSDGCRRFVTLGDMTPLSPEVLEAISIHADAIRQSRQSLSSLRADFCSTPRGFMTSGQSP